MDKKDEVYVTMINVPKEMTRYESTGIFVELRGEVVGYSKNEEPIVITKINNLSLILAASINWLDFWSVADKLIVEHFKTLTNANRSVTGV